MVMAHAVLLSEIFEERLATKEDLVAVKTELKGDINALKSDVDIKFAESESKMIK